MPQEVKRAVFNPRSLTSSMVMYLQRTAGNQAVVQLLADVRRPNTAAQAAETRIRCATHSAHDRSG